MRKFAKRSMKKKFARKSLWRPNMSKEEFISNLFLVSTKHGSNQFMINLKNLNMSTPFQHISFQYFKMEGLQCLTNVLKDRDCM